MVQRPLNKKDLSQPDAQKTISSVTDGGCLDEPIILPMARRGLRDMLLEISLPVYMTAISFLVYLLHRRHHCGTSMAFWRSLNRHASARGT